MNKILEKEKQDAIKAAKELWYGDDVVRRINQATSTAQIDNIMVQARKNM